MMIINPFKMKDLLKIKNLKGIIYKIKVKVMAIYQ
jgi:hypothetical protein